MFLIYRNQSTDLHCKSIEWFLYDGDIGVNGLTENENCELKH